MTRLFGWCLDGRHVTAALEPVPGGKVCPGVVGSLGCGCACHVPAPAEVAS